MEFNSVKEFIETKVFRNDIFVNATEENQLRALNQAEHILLSRLGKYFEDGIIPEDIMAYQSIWIMQVDDTFARAEMGASYIQMSGVMITIKDKDRTIAPYVLSALNISADPYTSGLSARKVGRYNCNKLNRG